ncbi:hypothetical protein [Halorubrum sp. Atlit-28R]|uniref:hypothetical protein n=1 Tax=Halorubrum sp. Atlit-28R TaxID=2282129 RepID=UPI000EF22A95|nr:hypothetical protein [Halorubrum sp. Atlit-28R]RLM50990.1 hypothetical protein DVK06_08865 [Halorubrum sp. Atlit-28R]
MYQAEHLDLFTTVNDEFTDDLTRLSGLLETVGEQADALDPIHVRVVVHDRQLRQLQRRVATTNLGDAVGDVSHTTSSSPSEIFRESVSDFRETVQGLDSPTSGLGNNAVLGAGVVGLMGLLDTLTNDGGGGDSGRSISPADIENFESALGFDFDRAFTEGSVSVRGAMTGSAPPFQLPEDELSELFSGRAFVNAFDFDALGEAMDTEIDGPRDLIDMDGSAIAEAAGFDSFSDVVDEFLDTRQFRRGQLLDTFLNLRVGMTQFYDILAAAIPLMGLFVGSLPATIGALGGLAAAAVGAAGALGGIAGLGLLGAATAQAGGQMPSLDDFREVLDELPDEFFEAFSPLAERLRPQFERGLEGLYDAFDRLAAAGAVLPALEDDARAFGRFAVPFVANTIEELLLLADASDEVFGRIAGGLEDLNVLRGLSGALADTLPQLTHLTAVLVGAIPAVYQFSSGLFDVFTATLMVATRLWTVISTLVTFGGVLGNGSEILGTFVGGVLLTASALFITTKVIQLARSELVTLTGVLIAQLIPGLGFTSTAVATLEGAFVSLGASSAFAATAANALYAALLGIATLTGIGAVLAVLSAGASYAANEFGLLGEEIENATDAYREFQRQERRMGSHGGRFLGNLDRHVYVDVTENNETTIEGDADASTVEYESFVSGSRSTRSYW